MVITEDQIPDYSSPSLQLKLLYKARAEVLLAGKSYSINGRMMTREDLPEIDKSIVFTEQRLAQQQFPGDGGIILTEFR